MKEGGTGLHKTIREINLVYKGLTQDMEEGWDMGGKEKWGMGEGE